MATTTVSPAGQLTRTALRPLGAMATAAMVAAIGLLVTVKLPGVTAGSALVGIALAAVAVWMFITKRYEWTLLILMLYLGLADGYLKLSSGSSHITIVRDLLLYAIAAGALLRIAIRRQRVEWPPMTGWVIAWVLVVAVQLFNPQDGTLSHSLASVRPHAEWVPLFFFGYYVMRKRSRLRAFLLALLFVAACNGVVGLIQLNLSPEQLAGWGPGYSQAIDGEGSVSARTFTTSEGKERTRPFALGGDFGFGGTLGMLAIPAALALLTLSDRKWIRAVTMVLAAGAVMGVATSEARTAVIASVIAVFAYAGLTVTSRAGLRTLVGIGVALVIGYTTISLLSSGSEKGSFRYESISSPGKALSTAFNYRKGTLAKIPSYVSEIPLGAGIGSKGPAAAVAGTGSGSKYDAESEPTYLLIEVGLPGLLVMIGFNLALFYLSVRRIRRVVDRETRILLTAVAAPLFAIFSTWFVGVTTATTPCAPYLWFSAGILSYWLLGQGRIASRGEGDVGVSVGARAEPLLING
jgi:hypothetical protein